MTFRATSACLICGDPGWIFDTIKHQIDIQRNFTHYIYRIKSEELYYPAKPRYEKNLRYQLWSLDEKGYINIMQMLWNRFIPITARPVLFQRNPAQVKGRNSSSQLKVFWENERTDQIGWRIAAKLFDPKKAAELLKTMNVQTAWRLSYEKPTSFYLHLIKRTWKKAVVDGPMRGDPGCGVLCGRPSKVQGYERQRPELPLSAYNLFWQAQHRPHRPWTEGLSSPID